MPSKKEKRLAAKAAKTKKPEKQQKRAVLEGDQVDDSESESDISSLESAGGDCDSDTENPVPIRTQNNLPSSSLAQIVVSPVLDTSTFPKFDYSTLIPNLSNKFPEMNDPKRTKVTSRSKKIIQDLKAKIKELEATFEKKDDDLKAALKQTSPALRVALEQKDQELKASNTIAGKATIEVARVTALFKDELEKIEGAMDVYIRLPRQLTQEALKGLDCDIETFKEASEAASKLLYIPGPKPRVPESNLTDEGVHVRTLIHSLLLHKALATQRYSTLEIMFNAQVVELADLKDQNHTLNRQLEGREDDHRISAMKTEIRSLEIEVAALKVDQYRLAKLRAELNEAEAKVATSELVKSFWISARAELAIVKSEKDQLELERTQEKKLFEVGLVVRCGFLAKAYRKYYKDEKDYDSDFTANSIRDGNDAIAMGKVDVDREVIDLYPLLGDAYRKIYFLTRREFSESCCVDTHPYLADVVNLHATIKVSWDFEYADETEPDYRTARQLVYRILDDGYWEQSDDFEQHHTINRDYYKVLDIVRRNVLMDEEVLSRVLVCQATYSPLRVAF